MTEQEFIKSLSADKVLIDLDTYEDLIAASTKLDTIFKIVTRNKNDFGLTREETELIKLLLGAEK